MGGFQKEVVRLNSHSGYVAGEAVGQKIKVMIAVARNRCSCHAPFA